MGYTNWNLIIIRYKFEPIDDRKFTLLPSSLNSYSLAIALVFNMTLGSCVIISTKGSIEMHIINNANNLIHLFCSRLILRILDDARSNENKGKAVKT